MNRPTNETLSVIMNRSTVRAYAPRPIEPEAREAILSAAQRAPTAGNMMLYSMIEITDQSLKDQLAVTCDNQPFIAKAPLVLLFLADYQRLYDYYDLKEVPDTCRARGTTMRPLSLGDLLLATNDAVIAAQTAVIAAESLGIGSCYIGDILEQYETHKKLLNLPPHAFPVSMLCFGYPADVPGTQRQTSRYDLRYICFQNRYHRLSEREFEEMHLEDEQRIKKLPEGIDNVAQLAYFAKTGAPFSLEMNRSVEKAVEAWKGEWKGK